MLSCRALFLAPLPPRLQKKYAVEEEGETATRRDIDIIIMMLSAGITLSLGTLSIVGGRSLFGRIITGL